MNSNIHSFTANQTVDLLLYILDAINWQSSIDLLQQATALAKSNEFYRDKMGKTLLEGSTIAVRDLFSEFGNYFEPSRASYPFYPHTDAVNFIDVALHWIRLDCFEDSIKDYKNHS